MKSKQTQSKTNYQAVEKNIYKVGNRYRVRVAEFSGYETTLTAARKTRTLFKKIQKSPNLF